MRSILGFAPCVILPLTVFVLGCGAPPHDDENASRVIGDDDRHYADGTASMSSAMGLIVRAKDVTCDGESLGQNVSRLGHAKVCALLSRPYRVNLAAILGYQLVVDSAMYPRLAGTRLAGLTDSATRKKWTTEELANGIVVQELDEAICTTPWDSERALNDGIGSAFVVDPQSLATEVAARDAASAERIRFLIGTDPVAFTVGHNFNVETTRVSSDGRIEALGEKFVMVFDYYKGARVIDGAVRVAPESIFPIRRLVAGRFPTTSIMPWLRSTGSGENGLGRACHSIREPRPPAKGSSVGSVTRTRPVSCNPKMRRSFDVTTYHHRGLTLRA